MQKLLIHKNFNAILASDVSVVLIYQLIDVTTFVLSKISINLFFF